MQSPARVLEEATVRVVVVGAGVVGACVAHRLARDGSDVTLVDPGGAGAGATSHSFGWIGAPSGADAVDPSTALRRRALEEHRLLQQELDGPGTRWCGSLQWGTRPMPAPARLHPGERLVGPDEVGRLEPRLVAPPAVALLTTTDGAVDAPALTAALVRASRQHGAVLHTDRAVTGLRRTGDRVVGVETTRRPLEADVVVLAAGTATPALCAPLGVALPVHPSPAVLLHLAAPPGLVRTVVAGPDLEVREVSPGRLLAAEEHRGETTPEELWRSGLAVLARLQARFRGAERVRLVEAAVAARPLTADGLPLVGPLPGHPGAYVAVLHFAVTLGPAVGRLVAAELLDGVPAPALDGLRPDRAVAAPDVAGGRGRSATRGEPGSLEAEHLDRP